MSVSRGMFVKSLLRSFLISLLLLESFWFIRVSNSLAEHVNQCPAAYSPGKSPVSQTYGWSFQESFRSLKGHDRFGHFFPPVRQCCRAVGPSNTSFCNGPSAVDQGFLMWSQQIPWPANIMFCSPCMHFLRRWFTLHLILKSISFLKKIRSAVIEHAVLYNDASSLKTRAGPYKFWYLPDTSVSIGWMIG